jgi:hypothetical protein
LFESVLGESSTLRVAEAENGRRLAKFSRSVGVSCSDYYDGLLNEPGNRRARTLNLLVEGSTSFWARDAGPSGLAMLDRVTRH